MKKLFFTFLISSSFLTVQADPKPIANGADFVISKMWESFVQGDHKMFAETMAQDPDMGTFGTDAAERWDGGDELQKSVKDQFKAFNILNVNRKNQKLKLSNSGEVAWFSEIVDWEFLVEGKKQIIKGVRYTGVMEKRKNEWKIVQFHSSVGVSGQVIAY